MFILSEEIKNNENNETENTADIEKITENKVTETEIYFNENKSTNETAKEPSKKANSHKGAFPVGLIVTILAIVGLCSIVFFSVKGINTAIKNNKNYDEYNKLLTPVVLMDPSPFDDITKADMNELIEISIWSLLKSDITPDKYTGEGNGLSIPKDDVEAEFTKLFGSEITPSHSTVEGYGYEFAYDSQAGKYRVPLTGLAPIYTPKVVEKVKKSDTIMLTVACLSGDAWQQNEKGEMVEPAPDKYIKVTLRLKDDGMFISAIQNTASLETVSAESTTEPITENKDLLAQAEQVAKETTTEQSETSSETTEEESKKQ